MRMRVIWGFMQVHLSNHLLLQLLEEEELVHSKKNWQPLIFIPNRFSLSLLFHWTGQDLFSLHVAKCQYVHTTFLHFYSAISTVCIGYFCVSVIWYFWSLNVVIHLLCLLGHSISSSSKRPQYSCKVALPRNYRNEC